MAMVCPTTWNWRLARQRITQTPTPMDWTITCPLCGASIRWRAHRARAEACWAVSLASATPAGWSRSTEQVERRRRPLPVRWISNRSSP